MMSEKRKLKTARVVIDLYPPKLECQHPDRYYSKVSPFDGHQRRSAAELDIADLESMLPGTLWQMGIRGDWLIYTEREWEDEEARGSAAPPASP